MLPRIQAFEFNDHPGVPPLLRGALVEALGRTLAWGRILDGLVPLVVDYLRETGGEEVLDLASGSGRPAFLLVRAFRRRGLRPPRFVLTDLHPHPEAWARLRELEPDAIAFHPEPVDATDLPPALADGRPRLVLNAFHHLPPDAARGVLAAAARDGAPIAVGEPFGRNPLGFLLNFPWAGIPAMLSLPLAPPPGPHGRLAFLAAMPALLATSAWDGVVSTLRQYDRPELEAMVADLPGRWTWRRWRFAPAGRGWWFSGLPPRPPDRPAGPAAPGA